jgi:hypothetical protein
MKAVQRVLPIWRAAPKLSVSSAHHCRFSKMSNKH